MEIELSHTTNPDLDGEFPTEALVDIADGSAFGSDRGILDRELFRDELDRQDVVYATVDGTHAGIASSGVLTELGDHIQVHGVWVHPDYQGLGLGSLLCVATVHNEFERTGFRRASVGAVTQHPGVVSLMTRLFDAYPDPDPHGDTDQVDAVVDRIPAHVAYRMDALAAANDYETVFDATWRRPVIEGMYGECLYPTEPDHDLTDFLRGLLDPDRGDAVLVLGETDAETIATRWQKQLTDSQLDQQPGAGEPEP